MIDRPFFVVSDREYMFNKGFIFNDDDLMNYVNKNNCIVATCNTDIVGKNVIHTPNKNIDPEEIAKIILKNTKNG